MAFAEAVAWIAFRDARPLEQWSRFTADKLNRSWPDWGFPRGITSLVGFAYMLLAALRARAADELWSGPAEGFGVTKWSYRDRAQRLVQMTGTDAATLARELEEDIEAQRGIDEAQTKILEEARKDLVLAIRDGEVEAVAHKALSATKSDPIAIAERLNSNLFLGAPRTVGFDGRLRHDRDEVYEGPFFDRVHLKTADIFKRWPADGGEAKTDPLPEAAEGKTAKASPVQASAQPPLQNAQDAGAPAEQDPKILADLFGEENPKLGQRALFRLWKIKKDLDSSLPKIPLATFRKLSGRGRKPR
jgi:hypothetical protein